MSEETPDYHAEWEPNYLDEIAAQEEEELHKEQTYKCPRCGHNISFDEAYMVSGKYCPNCDAEVSIPPIILEEILLNEQKLVCHECGSALFKIEIGDMVRIYPCERCISNTKDAEYERGYEKGLEEGLSQNENWEEE